MPTTMTMATHAPASCICARLRARTARTHRPHARTHACRHTCLLARAGGRVGGVGGTFSSAIWLSSEELCLVDASSESLCFVGAAVWEYLKISPAP